MLRNRESKENLFFLSHLTYLTWEVIGYSYLLFSHNTVQKLLKMHKGQQTSDLIIHLCMTSNSSEVQCGVSGKVFAKKVC